MKTILVDAWRTLFIEEGVNEEMKEILDSFENKKIVLTNANDEQIPKYGIDKSPYEVFSLENNPNKKDPVYFEKMLKHFDLNSDDVVYIEHNLESVESARKNGILSFHYDHEKRDLESLKEFLENNL